jgi:hypothetical protein
MNNPYDQNHASWNGLASFGETRWRCCGERSSRNSSSPRRKDTK